MGNVAIRIEEMVCQNLRGWQEGIRRWKGGQKRKEEEKMKRHNEVENFTGNKILSNWDK